MDIDQFNQFIIVPTLKAVSLYSPSANVLLLGTALIESNLDFIEQKGPGEALGVYQIEEATYNDILRYLNRFENARLKEACLSSCFYLAWPPREALIHNLRWSTIIARLKYYMISAPLPSSYDAAGMGAYYKKYYNTAEGDAELKEAIYMFESVIKKLNAFNV